LVVDKTKKSGFANQHEPGEPETPVRAAERIFPPAPALNLDKNSQFRHEPRRKMIGKDKDLMEVLATNAQTLREALSANSKPRGRGQFQLDRSICWVTTFDARHVARDSKSPAATHALDGLSFISPKAGKRKGNWKTLAPSVLIRTADSN
jgi:hypothetical protein